MPLYNNLSYFEYLASKKDIDTHSLNQNVLRNLLYQITTKSEKFIHVFEVGSGIGTMIERMLDWGLLSNAEYTAIDIEYTNKDVTKNRLSTWAHNNNFNFKIRKDNCIELKNQNNKIIIYLETVDLFDFIDRVRDQKSWDLLVANSFLDLVSLNKAIPSLLSLIQPNGLFYFTLNFDGETIFKPIIDTNFDQEVIYLYHKTMDERVAKGKKSGSSRTGSDLIELLIEMGNEILDAGSSDWVVFPKASGYSDDEKYFLHFIIHTIEAALSQCEKLNKKRFKEWIKKRHEHIDTNQLIYIAHQLDILGRIHS